MLNAHMEAIRVHGRLKQAEREIMALHNEGYHVDRDLYIEELAAAKRDLRAAFEVEASA